MNTFTKVVILCLLSILPIRLPAESQQPTAPPEIQRIINRLSNGGTLSPTDLKKLTDWTRKIQERFNVPGTTPSQFSPPGQSGNQGIPCRVTVTGNWKRTKKFEDGGSAEESGNVSITADAVLFATIKGTANFYSNPLSTSVGSSSFRFEPLMIAGRPANTGGGSCEQKTVNKAGSGAGSDAGKATLQTVSGALSKTLCGMLLVTTGTDKLFPTGSVGGTLTGRSTIEFDGHTDSKTADPNGYTGASDPGIPFAHEKHAFDERAKNHEMPGSSDVLMNLSYKTLAAAVTSGKTATILANESFTFRDSQEYDVSGNSGIRITLRPQKLELDVTPVDYEKWIPEGGRTEDTPGNRLEIKASLVDAKGNPPAARIAMKRITFELEATSHEPGVCMNWPVTTRGASAKADMRFEPDQNKGLTVSGNEQQKAESTSGEMTAKAKLTSFDWGGWTGLRVTAETVNGELFVGHLKGHDDETLIKIPKRESQSFIADEWKKKAGRECGRSLTGLDDGDDSENDPVGDGNKGDGFTLYEEYRGWMEGGSHLRGNPARKELLIHDGIGGRTTDGFDMLEALTHLAVHHHFKLEEFGKPDTSSGYTRSKCLNENHGQGKHIVDQHGVAIENTPARTGFAVAKSADNEPHTPKKMWYIQISASFDPGPAGWETVQTGDGPVTMDTYAIAVAHECLHCCNVPHHGNSDFGWIRLYPEPFNGSPIGLSMKAVTQPQVGARIFYERTGLPIPPDSPWLQGKPKVWLGSLSGQHSGVQDCIMRYAVAGAYTPTPDDAPSSLDMYITDPKEVVHIDLCKSPAGTAINGPNWHPRSRFGKAQNGDCIHRICVNDLYY